MSFYTRQSDELRRRGRARAAYAGFLAVRLDRAQVCRRAWAIARRLAAALGGSLRLHVAAGLRAAWQERRDHVRAISREVVS